MTFLKESEFAELKKKEPKEDTEKDKDELLKRASKKFDKEDKDPEEKCDPEEEDCKKDKKIKEGFLEIFLDTL